MKAHEFIGGIEFRINGGSGNYSWTYEPYHSDDLSIGTIHVCYASYKGSRNQERDDMRCQIEVKRTGIVFWSYKSDVYLKSGLIPFADLEVVSTPVIA